MSNRTFLKDGTNFVVNPEREADPIAARKEKVSFVSGLNALDMAKNPLWNVTTIRELATGLVPIMKDGKRLSKAEILDNLVAFIKEERESRLQTVDLFIKDHDIDTKLLDDLWVALSKQAEPTDLAAYIIDKLSKTYVTDTSLVKTGIPNLLTALRDDSRYLQHHVAVDRVKRLIYDDPTIKGKLDSINRNYKESVKDKQGNRYTVKVEPVIEYIETALKGNNWQEITYAIAFATGRRMAEILGNHSKWEIDERGRLLFTGILKGKNRRVDPKQLPDRLVTSTDPDSILLIDAQVVLHPLVSPESILSGIEKIKQAGKKVTHHERVNGVYGKAFASRQTEAIREMQQAAGLTIEVRNERGLLETPLKQFKTSRDFYAAYQAKYVYNSDEMPMTEEHFIMSRLHHDDLVATASYRKLKLV